MKDFEQRYFTNDAGEKIGRVNGTHCLVLIEKRNGTFLQPFWKGFEGKEKMISKVFL